MRKSPSPAAKEPYSLYFLKILAYFILGTVWITHDSHAVFPIGLALGALAAQHERLSIDRKIEYPILIVATMISLLGLGIYLSI